MQSSTEISCFRGLCPHRPPSTSAQAKSYLALSAFTLPPYRIEMFSATAPYFDAKWVRITACMSCACCEEAVLPAGLLANLIYVQCFYVSFPSYPRARV